jgi:hypothetical protein
MHLPGDADATGNELEREEVGTRVRLGLGVDTVLGLELGLGVGLDATLGLLTGEEEGTSARSNTRRRLLPLSAT